MKKCENCGFENLDDANYCAECGNQLPDSKYKIVSNEEIHNLKLKIKSLENSYIYYPNLSTGFKVLHKAILRRINIDWEDFFAYIFGLFIFVVAPVLSIGADNMNKVRKYHIAAESGQYALFKKDKQLTPYQYDTLIFYTDKHDNLTYILAKHNGKYGRLDNRGQIMNICIYDWLYNFSEEWAVSKKGDLYGFINKEAGKVIKPRFKDAYNFSGGFAAVQFADNTFGWIDETGKPVPWGGVTKAGSYSSGLAWTSIETDEGKIEYGYVDTRGNITNLHATGIVTFKNRRAFFSKGKGWAMINKSFTPLTDFLLQPWIDPSTQQASFPYVKWKGWKCSYNGVDSYINRYGKITPIDNAAEYK